jgi:cell division septum initiation protein DivIVA
MELEENDDLERFWYLSFKEPGEEKLKISHDSHVEIAELKVVLQENEALENELKDTKAIVGTFQNQKEELESQIQILKNEIEQLSLTDPNFSIANELGKLSVKDMEMKTLQEDLAKAKQDKLLREILANQESLTQ